MDKVERLFTIIETAGLHPSASLQEIIDGFIIDELTFAGVNAHRKKTSVKEEFDLVLEQYAFDGFPVSARVQSYIRSVLSNPGIEKTPHCFDYFVSKIGFYYDGTPVTPKS